MRGSVWAEMFPWPFVGVVVLLVALIFLTPNLISSSQPAAGSLVTQAELLVDRAPNGNVTHFYLEGLGNVRYATLLWSVATSVAWPPPPSAANVTWNLSANLTDSLVAVFVTSANPVAVNVSAVYVDAAGVAVTYVGAYAFYTSGGMLNTAPLLPGLAGVPPTSLSSLPIALLLELAPVGTG